MADLTRLMPYRRAGRFVWRNLAVFILIGSALITPYFFHEQRQLVHQNQARIMENNQRVTDIQNARVASCQQTYEGIRQVSKLFFRTKTQRTLREQHKIDKFNARIDELKQGCDAQTGVQP